MTDQVQTGMATVKCPTCGKMIIWNDIEKYRPFCSRRCQLIDLGEWANGSYSIPCKHENNELDNETISLDQTNQSIDTHHNEN